MDAEQDIRGTSWRIGWRRAGAGLLGLAVLSAVVFGPWGLLAYVAGFLKSYLLMMFFVLLGIVGWAALLLVACTRLVRNLRARHKIAADLWSSAAFGVVLAFALNVIGMTPVGVQCFGNSVLRRLEIGTDMNTVQRWVESLNPSDCQDDSHVGGGRRLSRGEQPEVLSRQDGIVDLELDAAGRPRVRLTWYEGRAGTWGLVIGSKDAKTPPSDPNMYGESRTELRPGIYFWNAES